jgi:hypothetical protein
MRIEARLFDTHGSVAAKWSQPLVPGELVLIDGSAEGPWRDGGEIEGVLDLFVCTEAVPSAGAHRNYRRLYPYVDWQGPGAQIASVHSDQVMLAEGRERVQQITEIVVTETPAEHNGLVILNGAAEQAPGALQLELRNASGEIRTARSRASMAPFSVNRIELQELVPGLVEFGGGKPLVVSGSFRSRGLFTRPYVVTTGAASGAYHAGDVYSWEPLPRFAHDLVGGEVNPVAVVEAGGVHTSVHVLHSHGDLGDPVAVDVSLYDLDGNLVAHRPGWTQARRHAASTFAISELLDGQGDFRGHVALRFAPGESAAVPRRLQALVEYRGTRSVARVMAWSDEWNSIVRQARRRRDPAAPRAFCRFVAGPSVQTEIAVTNAGHDGHNTSADVEFTLVDARGVRATVQRRIAPYATLWSPVRELFGDVDCDPADGFGILIARSDCDLASMMFTRTAAGLAAEHFLPVPEAGADGRWIDVAGQ